MDKILKVENLSLHNTKYTPIKIMLTSFKK